MDIWLQGKNDESAAVLEQNNVHNICTAYLLFLVCLAFRSLLAKRLQKPAQLAVCWLTHWLQRQINSTLLFTPICSNSFN